MSQGRADAGPVDATQRAVTRGGRWGQPSPSRPGDAAQLGRAALRAL